jgi:hypothetical protein
MPSGRQIGNLNVDAPCLPTLDSRPNCSHGVEKLQVAVIQTGLPGTGLPAEGLTTWAYLAWVFNPCG